MKTLLFILLFSGSLSAAEFLFYENEFFYFEEGDKIFACQPNKMKADCFSKDGIVIVKYKCEAVTEEEGYIKNCVIIPANEFN
jgi:hypothetical protein